MSKLETNTIDTVSGTTNLTIGSTNTSTITMPNGALSGQNYPAFRAYRATTQSISDNTETKVQIDTENFDTDSCYDNSTNYRFTPNVAGKYFVYAQIDFRSSISEDIHLTKASIKKNGSEILRNNVDPHNGSKANSTFNFFATVVDMNGSSDYLELFGQIDTSSGTPLFNNGSHQTYFGAYRIGA